MSHHRRPSSGQKPAGQAKPSGRSPLVYSLLKGTLSAAKPFSENPHTRPHYHLLITNGTGEFDVAINIASSDRSQDDTRVLYAIKDASTLPNLAAIKAFDGTIANLDATHGADLRLDFVKQAIVSRDEMTLLPLFDAQTAFGDHNDIIDFCDEAVRNQDATVYAFGHRYTDNRPSNSAWHFKPDAGVHNIHMNQGNARGNHDDENGRFSDGALLIHYAQANRWEIACIAFQTQSFDNGDDGFPK
jgi:uncharacterized protein YukJ